MAVAEREREDTRVAANCAPAGGEPTGQKCAASGKPVARQPAELASWRQDAANRPAATRNYVETSLDDLSYSSEGTVSAPVARAPVSMFV